MTGHSLIIGMSKSGKTTLAKILGKQYHARRTPVVVLDSLGDPEWERLGFKMFQNSEQFLAYISTIKSATLIVDEGGTTIGNDKRMNVITTTARHYGHVSIIIAHRANQLPTVLRDNCGTLFLFAVVPSSREIVYEDWGHDEIRNCDLKKGEFLYCRRMQPLLRGRIDFATRRITLVAPAKETKK